MDHLLTASIGVGALLVVPIGLIFGGYFVDHLSEKKFERIFGWIDRTKKTHRDVE